MAAFTTLALLGLGLAAGKTASDLSKKKTPVTAPGPQSAATSPTLTNPVAPPTGTLTAASSATAAIAAAAKQRKKAQFGSTSSIAKPTGTVLSPTLQPKTLLGA